MCFTKAVFMVEAPLLRLLAYPENRQDGKRPQDLETSDTERHHISEVHRIYVCQSKLGKTLVNGVI
jgi:hypothetical protein